MFVSLLIRSVIFFLLAFSITGCGKSGHDLTPEFYGFYANNSNKLTEITKNNQSTYDFAADVQFLVFQKQAEAYANGLKIDRAIFVRTVYEPGKPPENINTWRALVKGSVETRTKPVADQPEQIYVVPKSPLSAGVYIVSIDGKEVGQFFVDKNRVMQNLKQGRDCIDVKVASGWAGFNYHLNGSGANDIPCSSGAVTIGTETFQIEDLSAAFLKAVMDGNMGVVKSLVEKGADVNADLGNGTTPLMSAMFRGNIELVKVLLDKGADVNRKNLNGMTAMMIAMSKDTKSELVKVLLDKGADVNAKDNSGSTVLSYAISVGNAEIIAMLRAKGAH